MLRVGGGGDEHLALTRLRTSVRLTAVGGWLNLVMVEVGDGLEGRGDVGVVRESRGRRMGRKGELARLRRTSESSSCCRWVPRF